MDKKHIEYMNLVLQLAENGKGLVFPNPMVGALIVKNGKIISKGYHKFFGAEHAEAQALRLAGSKAEGADLYVNLEPCNNWGKCPPCADTIIKSKIKNVYCAMKDPNALTCGKGFAKLKKSGINIFCGILEKRAKTLNKEYIKHIKSVKPYILIKTASTFDGKTAAKTGDSKWISGELSRKYVHKLRTQYDAILVGTNTVLKDNPELSSHGAGKNPVRVILDEKLKTPKNYNVLDGSIPTIVFYDSKIKKVPSYFLKDCIKIVPADFKQVKKDFNVIIDKLNNMALKRIMVEGGGEINASVLKTGRANEMINFVAPVVAGGRDAKTSVEGDGCSCIKDSLKFKSLKVSKIGEDIVITGKF